LSQHDEHVEDRGTDESPKYSQRASNVPSIMQRIGMQADHIRLISVKPDYAKLSMDIAKKP
jgi:hypothetical protein